MIEFTIQKKSGDNMKKISYNSPVILSFALLSFVVLILNVVTKGKSNMLLFCTYRTSLADPLMYVRLFTHVLGHANIQHYINNMMLLLLIGPMLEEKHGSKAILEVILITAVSTGLINYFFFWNIGLCGASGVVFAFIMLASFTDFREGEIPITFILVAAIFIGQQVYEGIAVQDNISNMAHIVGGIVGAIIGYGLNVKAKYGLYR